MFKMIFFFFLGCCADILAANDSVDWKNLINASELIKKHYQQSKKINEIIRVRDGKFEQITRNRIGVVFNPADFSEFNKKICNVFLFPENIRDLIDKKNQVDLKYTSIELNEKISEITEDLRSQGYIFSQIEKIELEEDSTDPASCHDILMYLNLGYKYDLEIEGVLLTEKNHFKNILRDAFRNENGQKGIQLAKELVLNSLQSSGYYFASIEHKLENDNLLFVIEKGPLVLVSSVIPKGNKSFNNKEIEDIFFKILDTNGKERIFVPIAIEDTIQKTEFYLQAKGFPNLRITWFNKDVLLQNMQQKVSIELEILEGEPIVFDGLVITGASSANESILREFWKIKKGNYLDSFFVDDFLEKVRLYYNQSGYMYAELPSDYHLLIERLPNGNNANVYLSVVENEQMTIEKIELKGNLKTHNSIITQELLFKSGSIYNKSLLEESKKKLEQLGIFAEANITAVNVSRENHKVDILVEVTETSNNDMELSFGYASGSINLHRLELLYNVNFKNVAGLNQLVRLSAGSGINLAKLLGFQLNDQYLWTPQASIEYVKPNLLGTQVGLHDRVNFKITNIPVGTQVSTDHSLAFKLWDRLNVSYTFLLFEHTNFNSLAKLNGQLITSNATIVSNKVDFSWDERDHPLYPHWGTFLSGGMEYAPLSGSNDGIPINFVSMSALFNWYLSPLDFLTFANSSTTTYTDSLNSAGFIPSTRWFRLGGTKSIRGFQTSRITPHEQIEIEGKPLEDLTRGNGLSNNTQTNRNYGWLNRSEIRLPLFWRLGISFFYDIGNVYYFRRGVETPYFYGERPVQSLGIICQLRFDPLPPIMFYFSHVISDHLVANSPFFLAEKDRLLYEGYKIFDIYFSLDIGQF